MVHFHFWDLKTVVVNTFWQTFLKGLFPLGSFFCGCCCLTLLLPNIQWRSLRSGWWIQTELLEKGLLSHHLGCWGAAQSPSSPRRARDSSGHAGSTMATNTRQTHCAMTASEGKPPHWTTITAAKPTLLSNEQALGSWVSHFSQSPNRSRSRLFIWEIKTEAEGLPAPTSQDSGVSSGLSICTGGPAATQVTTECISTLRNQSTNVTLTLLLLAKFSS